MAEMEHINKLTRTYRSFKK